MTSIERHRALFALLLEHGLTTINEVVLWADSEIEKEDAPPYWLIEVSMSGSEGAHEMLHHLKGSANAEIPLNPEVLSLFMDEVRRRWRDNRIRALAVVRILLSLYWDNENLPVPEDSYMRLYSIEDAYEAVDSGDIHQSQADVELEGLFADYKAWLLNSNE